MKVVGNSAVPLRHQCIQRVSDKKHSRIKITSAPTVSLLALPVGESVSLDHQDGSAHNVFPGKPLHSHADVAELKAGADPSGRLQEAPEPGVARAGVAGQSHGCPVGLRHESTMILPYSALVGLHLLQTASEMALVLLTEEFCAESIAALWLW